jgi:hypothetical protein
MRCRVLADDIYDRHLSSAGVVQVRQAVGEPRSQMEEGAGRFPGHAGISVSRSSNDTLKKPEHATHLWHPVEGGDDMDF